jgi:phosphoribosylaminoimidazolecarboxamide formyltransferase/IMP cyclohydrolase
MNSPKIERALVSVSNKTGLLEFAQALVTAGVEIYASGGSRKHLEEAGIPVREVAAYTGFPEMMDGRIKTLHPKIHGGILCRRDNPEDMKSLADHGIVPFELVVSNLYPFRVTIAKPGVTIDQAIENIDIGGPTLIRAAAKNHAFVTIACEPDQYGAILEQMKSGGSTTPEFRRELAGAAFAHTASYDTAIAYYFAQLEGGAAGAGAGGGAKPQAAGREVGEEYPETIQVSLRRSSTLRYGENPHQTAAVYAAENAGVGSLLRAKQLHGKELSYNNLLDLDSALAMVKSLPIPSVVVVKHNNPCGAAGAETIGEAAERAWSGDPLSAFGSVLGFNEPVDAEAANFLSDENRFVEAIIAPEFTPEAFEILTTKPKWKANVRLLSLEQMMVPAHGEREFRHVSGGMLYQMADNERDDDALWQAVTEAKATKEQGIDLRLAWAICRHVKSNAIVLVKDLMVIGVGAGQMSRVDSVEIAIKKAGDRSRGSVLASDAFFPFADSIHQAAEAGITAVIQPGGSRRDDEVVAACNQHGIAMIFTGHRHFRH